MSSNPDSINYRDPDLEAAAAERATARGESIDRAVAATTGQDGLDEGDASKAQVENDPTGIDFAE